MSKTFFAGGRVVLPDRVLEGYSVIVEGRRIVAIEPGVTVPDGDVIDATGKWVAPGLIDVHVHGGGGSGFDWERPWSEWIQTAGSLARFGVTGFLATAPAPLNRPGRLSELQSVIGEWAGPGSILLGLNFEGPFLNPARRGAWAAEGLSHPAPEACRRLMDAGGSLIRLVTIAPDLPGSMECIEWLARAGVRVSLGHTDARYDLALRAYESGARHVTHLYNAMSGLHHREPGLVGAALDTPGLMAEIIADGVHVHPAAMRVAYRAKGPDGICLITDATPLAGVDAPKGECRFGQFPVWVVDGVCRTAEGDLAGSLLTLNRAVAGAVSMMRAPVHEAFRMASLTPARSIGVDRMKGSLEAGKDADIAIFDDTFEPVLTMVEGRVVYRRGFPALYPRA